MPPSRTSKVLALSLGQGLTTIVALASGMVMARILSQTELATYRQTMLAYDVAVPLLSLGIASGLYYFLPTEEKRVRGVVMDGLTMMIVMGLVYAVFIALGGNHLLARRFSNPAIADTLAYLVPLPIVMLPAGLLPAVMVVQNQVKKLAVYNVLSSLLLAVSVIGACLWWRNPEAMILARVGIGVVIGLAAVVLILQSTPGDDWRPCWSGMKTMVAFSIPLVAATTMSTISVQLDKIIVSAMCAPEDFAVYATGAFQIPLVGIITGSIAAVIQPDLRRMVAAGDNAGAVALFNQAAMKAAVMLLPVMFFLLISAEPFILTLFSAKYAGSILPFRLYLLILPMRIVTWGTLMMALGLNRAIMYRSAAGLVANVATSILLVRLVGFNGAILATILCLYLVEGVWCFAAISRAVKVSWWQIVPFGMLFRIALVSILACLPVMALMLVRIELPPLVRLAINGAAFTLAFVGLARMLKVEVLPGELLRAWQKFIPGFSPTPRYNFPENGR